MRLRRAKNAQVTQPNGPTQHTVEVQNKRIKKIEILKKKLIAEHFPNMIKYLNVDIQKVQQTPSRMNSETYTKTYIKSNFQK